MAETLSRVPAPPSENHGSDSYLCHNDDILPYSILPVKSVLKIAELRSEIFSGIYMRKPACPSS